MKRDDVIEFKEKLEEFFGRPVVLQIGIHKTGDAGMVELAAHGASRLVEEPVTRHAVRGEYGDTWWAQIGAPFPNGIEISVFGSGPAPDGWEATPGRAEV